MEPLLIPVWLPADIWYFPGIVIEVIGLKAVAAARSMPPEHLGCQQNDLCAYIGLP